MTKLYPLKFKPILKERIWGGNKLETTLNKPLGGKNNIGESWEISAVEGSVSVVENGFLKDNTINEIIEVYMGELVGERVFKNHGHEFPLLIKFIDAREDLSIQVHPNDETARKRHNSNGKTEMWYVMHADKGAQLVSGFKKEISKQQYLEAIQDNSIEQLLARHPVSAGDVFYMPAGRVHAIGAGIMLAEIQQTSDVTYRIYDFNRRDKNGHTRELHTELATDVIDTKIYDHYKTTYTPALNHPVEIVNSPCFNTRLIDLNQTVERDYYALDSFVIIICIEGSLLIEYNNQQTESLEKGETILIPAELRQIKIVPESKSRILEVTVP